MFNLFGIDLTFVGLTCRQCIALIQLQIYHLNVGIISSSNDVMHEYI